MADRKCVHAVPAEQADLLFGFACHVMLGPECQLFVTFHPLLTHTHTHTHTHTAALSAAYLYLYCSGGGDTRCLPVLDVQSTGGPSPGISPLGLCGELIHACECAART